MVRPDINRIDGAIGPPYNGPMSDQLPENELERTDGGKPAKSALARAANGIRRRFESQSVSIKIHGFAFLIGSAGFIFLNSISTHFPWAFFPIVGWCVGLGAHLRAFLSRRRELGQISALPPEASDEAVHLMRKYQLCHGAWDQHLTAYVTANAYVWGINLITSMAFPWAAFVTGLWGIGLGCHWMSSSAKRKSLKRRLRELGIDLDALRPFYGSDGSSAYHPLTDKARALVDQMAAKYKANKGIRGHWNEIEPLLGTALAQIQELETKSIDFDRLTASISDSGLERDLAELKRKRALAGTPLLQKEYDKSIAQYESHLKASSDLRQHREILDLRLASAINLVKQLEIDTVRLVNLDSYEEPASLRLLRDKTDENQAFLEDFRSGMEKLENG
jgi:hypothetical protein